MLSKECQGHPKAAGNAGGTGVRSQPLRALRFVQLATMPYQEHLSILVLDASDVSLVAD